MAWPARNGQKVEAVAGRYGYITYRKAAVICVVVFVFFIYIGPGILRWLLGSRDSHVADPLATCLDDKLGRWTAMVAAGNGHVSHRPH